MDKRQINDLIACILMIAFLLFTTIKYKYVARVTSEGWKRWAGECRNRPILRILLSLFLLFVTVSVLWIGFRGDFQALVLGGIVTIVVIWQMLWVEPWIRLLEWQSEVLDRFPWLIIVMNALFILIGALWFLISAILH
jgi:hypothetical protein